MSKYPVTLAVVLLFVGAVVTKLADSIIINTTILGILAGSAILVAFTLETIKIKFSEPRISFSTVVEKDAGYYVYLRRVGLRLHNKGPAIKRCRATLQSVKLVEGDLPNCARQDRLRWKSGYANAECEIDIGPNDENQIIYLAQTTAGQQGSFWGDFIFDYCKNGCESIHGVYLVEIRIDGEFGEQQSMKPKTFSGYLFMPSNQEIHDVDLESPGSPPRDVIVFERGGNWNHDTRIPLAYRGRK